MKTPIAAGLVSVIAGRFRRWLDEMESKRVLDEMASKREQEQRQKQKERHIPKAYLKGYRRLAPTAADVIGEHCWNCRHEVAFVTWWCDLDADHQGSDCKWERCHVADELTWADLRAGRERWIGLPPEPPGTGDDAMCLEKKVD